MEQSVLGSANGTNGQDVAVLARTRMSEEDLCFFRQLLTTKRAEAEADIDRMRDSLQNSRDQQSDSAYSFHMADAGTDAMEREKLQLMIARTKKHVGYIDRALDRIEQGTYGICNVTGNLIQRERLVSVPHTQISIDAKLQQKPQQTRRGLRR